MSLLTWNTFRARSVSPTGGEGRFIQGKYSGHLSSFPETLNLLDVEGNLLTTTTYLGDPSDAQLYLVVSEIMYHPDGDGLAEFIELTNISDTVTLDLTGVKFVQGVEFDFTGSAVTSLAPGARVLLVRDSAAFNAAHGGGNPVAGVFANLSRLNNDGETLKLEDALNGTIREFIYNDAAPWPVAADAGYSLVLVNPTANPDPDVAANWRSSALAGWESECLRCHPRASESHRRLGRKWHCRFGRLRSGEWSRKRPHGLECELANLRCRRKSAEHADDELSSQHWCGWCDGGS